MIISASGVRLLPGNPLEPGATIVPNGVNFSVFSRNATGMVLCLYENAADASPTLEFPLDPAQNRTGDIWHCKIEGVGVNTLYLWRADGPFRPEEGQRFNKNRSLIDPYAKALTDGTLNFSAAIAYEPGLPDSDLTVSSRRDDSSMPKCIVVDDFFDWGGDTPLNYPLKDCIIYETHVRGLTRGSGAPAEHPGTYRGVAEMAGYFNGLGISSVELLPVQEFDSTERFRRNPKTGQLLSNYWGYSPIAFFAPKAAYAYVDGEPHPPSDPARQVREFKYMVRELHRAGIEVILDVVFNHTAEGNELGPTLSFRGLDNTIYYILDANKRYYKNFSGCGNTLNCNQTVMRSLIRDCLRYWVVHMHVDGFRFDLGSILGRDSEGHLIENPPVIESIAEDSVLRNTKIIAEAWDAGGAYQVGAFPGGRWAEWNDKYRDDVRRFWKGEKDSARHLATRITGSSDLYLRDGRKPFHSINFIAAHDGFTLNDLVSYERKNNWENGEENRDGADINWSFNSGVEGESDDPAVESARNRQVKNYLATLLLSVGTPMLLGGDEFRRTQRGNNNAYCQDNPISWYDWGFLAAHADVWRFCRELVCFRKRHPALRRREFFTGKDNDNNHQPDIAWFDEHKKPQAWSAASLTLAALVDGSDGSGDETGETAATTARVSPQSVSSPRGGAPGGDTPPAGPDCSFYYMFNASLKPVEFLLPSAPGGRPWRRVVDTAAESPSDIDSAPPYDSLASQKSYRVAASSFVFLVAEG